MLEPSLSTTVGVGPVPPGPSRETFLGSVVRALGTTLEETVGIEEAKGFISVVGLAVGAEIQAEYLKARGTDRLDRPALVEALVDLKRRVGGDFELLEQTDERIVLANRRCPFGDLAKACPSLCMMTSNMIGHLVAESQGYARVILDETIAGGASACRIVIDLDPDAPDAGARYHRR